MQIEHERQQFRKVLDAARTRVKQLEDQLEEQARRPVPAPAKLPLPELNDALSFIVAMADCEDSARDREWIRSNWQRHEPLGLQLPSILATKLAVEALWSAAWQERADLEAKIIKLLEKCEMLQDQNQLGLEQNALLAQLERQKAECARLEAELSKALEQLARKRQHSDVPTIPLKGELYKKGNNSSNWRPRYLDLREKELLLFDKKPTTDNSRPKKLFRVAQMSRILKSVKQPYAFKIVFKESANESNIHLDALNLETLQRWMFSLTWCIARAKGEAIPSSPRSAVVQAELDPGSPKSSPSQGVDVDAVMRALGQCDERDIDDVEQCIEAMSAWVRAQRSMNGDPAHSSTQIKQGEIDFDF